jgi:glycosyltransferase involved in cell wall biosynthesis
MKIVYYTHPFLLDCDLPLIKEMQKKGHTVMMFISLAPYSLHGSLLNIKRQIKEDAIIPASIYPEMNEYSQYIKLENIFFINRTKSSVLTLTYARLILQMCKMIRRFNPDIVHITYPLDLLEILLLQFRNKMLLVMHDPFPHSGKENLRNTIARYISIKLIPKIVLLNNTQKNQFAEYYKIPLKKILINKLGPYNCILNFRPNLTINNEKIKILFFGLISPYKGLEYLCEAMLKVHNVCPNVELIIAGKGNIYFDFEPYKNLQYIQLHNRYIDMQELASFLYEASFVICPYKDATQSGVIMTSFAMERPIIASNVGSLKEQIENGKTGLLIPPCDSEVLADAIINLSNNPQLIDKMKQNIKELNTIGYNSWDTISNIYLDFYTR